MTDDLFGGILQSVHVDEKYTRKIKTPVYYPSEKCPHILELIDDSKTQRLIKKIQASGVSEAEKAFLVQAAYRHAAFNYTLIADYYAHATPEMQDLMEQSALVIIDFMKAIEHGYVDLSSEIVQQYLNDYENGE